MRKLKSLILKQCTRKKIILSPKKLVLNPLEPSNCIAKTMCVLKCVKVHLKILGCIPVGIDFIHLPFYGVKIPFNSLHITCIFTILIGNMVATFWFYIREVKTFGDFSESVFWGSRSVLSLVLYTLLICRKTKLAQFFQSIDEIAGKRKFIQTQLTGPFMFVKVHNDEKGHYFSKTQAIKISYSVKSTKPPIVSRMLCSDASVSIRLLPFQYCMSFRLHTNHIMPTTQWTRHPSLSNYSIKWRMYNYRIRRHYEFSI